MATGGLVQPYSNSNQQRHRDDEILLTSSDFHHAFDNYIERELSPMHGKNDKALGRDSIKRQLEALEITWEQFSSRRNASIIKGTKNDPKLPPSGYDHRSLGGQLKLANKYLIVHIEVSSAWTCESKIGMANFSCFVFQLRAWCTLNPAQFQLDDSVSIESELINQQMRERIKADELIQKFMLKSPQYSSGNEEDDKQSKASTAEQPLMSCHVWTNTEGGSVKESPLKANNDLFIVTGVKEEGRDGLDCLENVWFDENSHSDNENIGFESSAGNVNEVPCYASNTEEFVSSGSVDEESLEFLRKAVFSEMPSKEMVLELLTSLPWLTQQNVTGSRKQLQEAAGPSKTANLSKYSITSDAEMVFKFRFESFEEMARAHSIARDIFLCKKPSHKGTDQKEKHVLGDPCSKMPFGAKDSLGGSDTSNRDEEGSRTTKRQKLETAISIENARDCRAKHLVEEEESMSADLLELSNFCNYNTEE